MDVAVKVWSRQSPGLFSGASKRSRFTRLLAVGLLTGLVLTALAAIGPPATARADSGSQQTQDAAASSDAAQSAKDASAAAATPSPSHAPKDIESTPSHPPNPDETAPPIAPETLAITSPTDGATILGGSVTVYGTRNSADTVQVASPIPGHDEPACVVDPNGSTAWSCVIDKLPDGPAVRIRAVVVSGDDPPTSITVKALAPPVVSPGLSQPVLTWGVVKGSGYPDAKITVTASNGASDVSTCSFWADANGAWACVLDPIPRSGTYSVTALQTANFAGRQVTSNTSTPASIMVDSEKPAAPTMTTPSSSATITPGTSVHFAGTGEEGATVSVYANSRTLCKSKVISHNWSCTAQALPANSYSISALQTDPAGNTGAGSRVITLTYVAPATKPSHTTPPAPSHNTAPSHSTAPAPSQHPSSPSPTPSTPAPSPPAFTLPLPPDGGGPGSTPPHHFQTTPFTAAVQSAVGPQALPGWLRSLGLAVASLLLLVLPARLLAGMIATSKLGRMKRVPLRFTGRNMPRTADDSATGAMEVSSRMVSGAALLAAAALVTLSSSVENQAAYLRLFGAIVVTLLVINALVVLVPKLLLMGHRRAMSSVRFAPKMLWLVALLAIASRVLEFQPALLFGVIFGVSLAAGAGVAERGRVACAQTAALAILGLGTWLILGALPAPSGSVGAFFAELANSLVLTSVGSASVMLIPLGKLPGRAIFAWSRRVWLGMILVVDTVLFALLIPADGSWQGSVHAAASIVFAVGFAAVSVSLWLWRRYVAPLLG